MSNCEKLGKTSVIDEDLRAFAIQFPSLTYPSRFAAIAYFLRERRDRGTVARPDSVNGCAAAGWSKTRNGKRELSRAVEVGLLHLTGTCFELTGHGADLVEDYLNDPSFDLRHQVGRPQSMSTSQPNINGETPIDIAANAEVGSDTLVPDRR